MSWVLSCCEWIFRYPFHSGLLFWVSLLTFLIPAGQILLQSFDRLELSLLNLSFFLHKFCYIFYKISSFHIVVKSSMSDLAYKVWERGGWIFRHTTTLNSIQICIFLRKIITLLLDIIIKYGANVSLLDCYSASSVCLRPHCQVSWHWSVSVPGTWDGLLVSFQF